VPLIRATLAPLALLVAGVVGIVWCASDGYRRRAALFEMGRLTDRSQADWSPSERPEWYAVDSTEALAPYTPLAHSIAGKGDTHTRAKRLLTYVSELADGLPEDTENVDLVDSDDVAEIMAALQSPDYIGNCAHFAAILHTLSQAAEIQSRYIGISGDGWIDGRGHGILEVFLPESGNWMVLDPYYHVAFYDTEDRPLSILDIRDRIEAGRQDEISLVQGELHTGRIRPDDESVLDVYGRMIQRVVYVGSSNSLDGRRAIYDSWLARTIRLKTWPRPIRRAMENLVWNLDRRFIYIDRPELEDPFIPYYVFRASVALTLIGFVWLVLALLRSRRLTR